jgi:hypothetical protein
MSFQNSNQKITFTLSIIIYLFRLLKFILINYSLTVDSIINESEFSDEELKKLKFIKVIYILH